MQQRSGMFRGAVGHMTRRILTVAMPSIRRCLPDTLAYTARRMRSSRRSAVLRDWGLSIPDMNAPSFMTLRICTRRTLRFHSRLNWRPRSTAKTSAVKCAVERAMPWFSTILWSRWCVTSGPCSLTAVNCLRKTMRSIFGTIGAVRSPMAACTVRRVDHDRRDGDGLPAAFAR